MEIQLQQHLIRLGQSARETEVIWITYKRENRLSQSEHWKGFSRVCMRTCRVRCSCLLKLWLHMEQQIRDDCVREGPIITLAACASCIKQEIAVPRVGSNNIQDDDGLRDLGSSGSNFDFAAASIPRPTKRANTMVEYRSFLWLE